MKKYRLIIAGDDVSAAYREAFRAEDTSELLRVASEEATSDFSVYKVATAEGFEAARLQLLGMSWEDNWRKDDVLLAFFEDDKLVRSEEY